MHKPVVFEDLKVAAVPEAEELAGDDHVCLQLHGDPLAQQPTAAGRCDWGGSCGGFPVLSAHGPSVSHSIANGQIIKTVR